MINEDEVDKIMSLCRHQTRKIKFIKTMHLEKGFLPRDTTESEHGSQTEHFESGLRLIRIFKNSLGILHNLTRVEIIASLHLCKQLFNIPDVSQGQHRRFIS